jgi:hypothetical protein
MVRVAELAIQNTIPFKIEIHRYDPIKPKRKDVKGIEILGDIDDNKIDR